MTQTPQPPSIPKIAIVAGILLAVIIASLWAIFQLQLVNTELATKITKVVTVLILAIAVALAVVWSIWRLALWMKESRSQKQEAQAVIQRPGASPEEMADLEDLQEKINTAVKVLRESKLARGRTAEEALYTLPWVLLLGPEESGKTSILRECGVDFPYTTLEMRKFAKKDKPSACDFWFSREGIILDLAGKMATGVAETDLLSGFLDQLKRARRTRPIDGVVVTVSIRDVLDSSPEQIEKLANVLRQRFDLLIRRLGIRFPIYILFTKCDQVEGFKEFFANMRGKDRAQVWGATISRAQRKRLPAVQIFQQEFDRLVESLYLQRLQLMASESDTSRVPPIFTFPAQFSALRPKLATFVEALLEPTPYSERPMFRGFYLSSATAEAAAPEPVRAQQQKWDALPYRVAVPQEPPKPAKVFFLETLFPEVIFADRPQATDSVDKRLKRRLIHDIALAATVVISIFLLGFTTYSFVQNSNLIDTINKAALPLSDPGWSGRGTLGLRTLDELRKKLVEIGGYESDGAPWKMRWGLYSGADMYEPLRRTYTNRLREFYLNPSAEGLRQTLLTMTSRGQQTVSYDDFYGHLKTYLIMTVQPSEPAPEEWALNNGLEAIWKQLSPKDPEGQALALMQLHHYAHRMSLRDPDLPLKRDDPAILRARQALCRYSAVEQAYARLKGLGNAKLKPFTLEQATGGKYEYLTANREVPGVFTDAGWSTYFRDAIGQASKSGQQDDWVLGNVCPSGQTADSNYEAKLREWYFAEYAEAWYRFLEGISIRPLGDINEAKNALDLLSQQDASINRLLQSVAANTMLRLDPKPAAPAAAASAPTVLQRPNRSELIVAVADKFAPLHEIATSLDGKVPSLTGQYCDALGRIRSQFQNLIETGTQGELLKGFAAKVVGSASGDDFREAYRIAQKARQTCSVSRYCSPVGPLLELPIRQAWGALLRDMMGQLDVRWKNQVVEGYRREVEPMFPFNPNGQDIPFPTMAKYFKTGDGLILGFYEREVKPLMPSEGGSTAFFTLKPSFTREFTDFLEKARAIRDALYSSGTAEPSVLFDLTPEGGDDITESILEIDGQPQLRYRNEPQMIQSFSWPGKPGPPQARISIAITSSSERPNIPNITGDWAFFRLLQRAMIDIQSATSYRIRIPVQSTDPRKFVLKYRLQARNAANPFPPGFFRDVRCPDKVIQPGGSFAAAAIPTQ